MFMSEDNSENSFDVIIGDYYQITKDGVHKKRIGKALSISVFGDVMLELKDGRRILFNHVWLKPHFLGRKGDK